MKFRYLPHLTIAVLVIAAFMFYRVSLQPVLASSDDDVKKLTEIEVNQVKVHGWNPASIALEGSRLAETVTLVGATGVVKHVAKDTLLATAERELPDMKFSVAISGLQVHLYSDTAIVTYQRKMLFVSPEAPPVMSNFVGRSFRLHRYVCQTQRRVEGGCSYSRPPVVNS